MEGKSILIFVIVVILIIMVVRYVMKDVNTLTELTDAKTMQKIAAEDLESSTSTSSGTTSNFTYSIWFLIDDWNYRYGKPKIIFARMAKGAGQRQPCPSVVLGPTQNNIVVNLAVFPGLDEVPENNENFIVHTCSIANVPIQRWCNILVSAYGRTLDLYLDGKLVRTCVLPGVAKIDTTAPVYVTPMGGFSGWTAKFEYWPESSDPQKAWDVYKAGYGGSLLGGLGKYTVKISLMEGEVEEESWTL